MNYKLSIVAVVGAFSALSLLPNPAAAQSSDCSYPIGAVVSLSGSMAAIGGAIANAGQLAVEHMNEAGGLLGCKAEYRLRDDQGLPNVGIDAAKSLVAVEGAEVILGAIQSGVTMPILTSVAVPENVTQISCCSSAPSFTELARKGGTDGYWFRTLPTVRPQGFVMSELAAERGYSKVAVIYVNSDYGLAMAEAFEEAHLAGGGEVKMVAYNQEQASYRAEVSQALQGEPDALFLVAFPADGATAMREWISFGGTQNILLSNALRSKEFIEAVGEKYLTNAVGIDNAQFDGPSVDAFNSSWKDRYGEAPEGPGLHTMYDAAAVALLAAQASGTYEGTAIRDTIRKITGPGGEVINPGPEGFARAIEALKQGKSITYVGATGPIEFDQFGDVSGPYLLWGIAEDGELTNIETWSVERVNALMADK
ncbi:ABC transporter substrate-binding protein [Sulfitobacter sp. SH24]|uniref:ABC transporter substrate-binding protein n=1 Tax=Sulfitobacter sp. SH24 TaxID=3421173 RepID=UPI003F4F4100